MNSRRGSRKRRDSSTINPVLLAMTMMNDVILKHLFGLLSHRELNTVRQVSKQWYRVSLPVWLKNGPPKAFRKEKLFKRFVCQGRAKNTATGSSHGSHSSEIDGIRRYAKFKLAMDEYEIRDHDLFLELHGPWLTHLTLRYKEMPGVVRFLDILTCKFTPKLEYLEVDCSYHSLIDAEVDEGPELPMDVVGAENRNLKEFRVDYSRRWGQLPMDWKTLLSHYPNLEHFKVGNVLSGVMEEGLLLQMEPILAAIKEIRNEDKSKLNLKSLIWFYNMSDDRCGFFEAEPFPPSVPEAFRQAQLQLHSFQIDFCEEDSDELIDNILSSFASSLKKLRFHKPTAFQHHPFRNMDQLQSLTLTGYPVKNLLFLTQLPALRSLSLWGGLWGETRCAKSIISATRITNYPSGLRILTFPSLTKFRVSYKVEWRQADLLRLRGFMPSLTELEMRLDNATFRLVCQLWPRLEHLSAYRGTSSILGDAGIVGLVKNGPEIVYNQPNITILTELKSFAMDIRVDGFLPSNSDFSQHSVLAGFANLARLQQLSIKTYSVSLNPAVKELILSKFPFAKIQKIG